METLQLLAVALGLASLAGLRLYLTVFLTGLAVHQQWIVLNPPYEALLPLGNPLLIGLSGTLCLIEFLADKIPWVDSLWDSIHTVLRPVAGSALALRAFGETSPVFDIAIALLGGSIALSLHGTKAGVRLLANGSPEPFSNIALSLGEEIVVFGGLLLLYINPVLALVILALFLTAMGWFAPKLWRGTRVILWLVWKKIRWPAASTAHEEALPKEIPSRYATAFEKHNLLNEKIAWAVPCISGGRLPSNLFGMLVATEETPNSLTFVARRGVSTLVESVELQNAKVSRQSQFLSENLLVENEKRRVAFIFPRSEADRVKQIVKVLTEREHQVAGVQ